MLESRSRVCGFEPDCVVSLSKTLYPLLSTGSTQEGPSQHNCKNVDWNVNLNQANHSLIIWNWPMSSECLITITSDIGSKKFGG